jgi:amino acid transporter
VTALNEAPAKAPSALPAPDSLELPETFLYRVKNALLGPPLVTEALRTERLGRPTALAILSSDVLSSSAYATETMMFVLVGAIGLSAYSLTVPITIAVLAVLALVTMSYREVVEAYPKAGGAYVVSRENFGTKVAQVAAVSLLIDYTLTVAVSVAAGISALASAISQLAPYVVELSVVSVFLIAYANLRGIREAGRAFVLPTYLFIANMALLILVGTWRYVDGTLQAHSIHQVGAVTQSAPGSAGFFSFAGASLFIVLKAFSSGGSALTGTEAISNGVSVFRKPESKNARATLLFMALILGSMFLGVSVLTAWTHAVPFESGTPTVLSQLGRFVYGHSGLGQFFFYALQVATLAILVLAANTSFTGFPFLASFAAEDSFLPRQLTRRGHRLVFSNGIILLTVFSVILIVATRARLNSLIALYAVGVFTGFTMTGAGMVKHHLTHKKEGWRRRLVINGAACVLTFIVDIVIIVTKFTEGAWVIVVLLPLLSVLFIRLHRQYTVETEELERDAPVACRAQVLRRHVVLVFVDRIDLATARAIQYARTLSPDDVRAVHFVLDATVASELEQGWALLGLSQLSLELIECPDRRISRGALELVAETLEDGETEVTVLLPRRAFRRSWSRLLHDRTADRIASVVGQLAHANATIVPFQLGRGMLRIRRAQKRVDQAAVEHLRRVEQSAEGAGGAPAVAGATPIDEVQYRKRARVAGRISAVRIHTSALSPSLACRLVDESGGLTLVFTGRRKVPGIIPGTRLVAEGMVNEYRDRLAIFNPDYELVDTSEVVGSPPE